MILWVQEYTESERGCGRRPDGYTLHLSVAVIKIAKKVSTAQGSRIVIRHLKATTWFESRKVHQVPR